MRAANALPWRAGRMRFVCVIQFATSRWRHGEPASPPALHCEDEGDFFKFIFFFLPANTPAARRRVERSLARMDRKPARTVNAEIGLKLPPAGPLSSVEPRAEVALTLEFTIGKTHPVPHGYSPFVMILALFFFLLHSAPCTCPSTLCNP